MEDMEVVMVEIDKGMVDFIVVLGLDIVIFIINMVDWMVDMLIVLVVGMVE